MDIFDIIEERALVFDGGMGMLLAGRGHLKPGEAPYTLNLSSPQAVLEAHNEYAAAGADVITTNTFTASDPAVVRAGVSIARQSGARFVALDLGPTGRLMEPLGDLTFEEAYSHFASLVDAGSGADLILIETMSDLYECKAAILAAKEHSSLPVFCTVTLQENGRTLTGSDIPSITAVLEGLGADALGINCSLGPAQLAPFVSELVQCASVPVIVQPNAGLPRITGDGETVYDVTPEEFAEYAAGFIEAGARVVGGCCGTTPETIRAVSVRAETVKAAKKTAQGKAHIIACSGTKAVYRDAAPVIIGERLNPTGKKRLQKALREDDMETVKAEAVAQQEAGCHILDVNAGMPDIDEPAVLARMVRAVQSVSNLPVQIDSSDPAAIEAALRVVNGKAVINSVNGKRETLDAILPLAKKYGASVVGLTLDGSGIPETAEERFVIAQRIRDAAEEYGIPGGDILIDCLTLTAAAQPGQAMETLRAVRMVREELGLATVLGVSNVSYGLPEREKITASFLTAALASGLNAAILNPLSQTMRDTLTSWRVLSGDVCPAVSVTHSDEGLSWYIEQYDKGTVFLPELLAAAKREIEQLRASATSGVLTVPPVILASVRGDIHDIGKNIVKTLLECHGFPVIDLGKDVPAERVVEAVREHGSLLVGLSALMTTTVKNMCETIAAIKEAFPACSVMIGGAAVSADVSADAVYGRDALEAVAIAKRVLLGQTDTV